MFVAEAEHSGAPQTTSTSVPPGVYRTLPSERTTTVSSSIAIETQIPPAEAAHKNTAPSRECDVSSTVIDARRRFYQLRTLRRELSGRSPVPEDSKGTATTVPSTPSSLLLDAQAVQHSVPASHGLPLDRLPVADPATRYTLRTAAAERALRHQQAENDELKRLLIAQRQEAEALRQQLERVSHALAASSDTVLRQTATMRALTSEMERRDAYHLIKERRASACKGTTGEEARVKEQLRQPMKTLTAEMAQLKHEKKPSEQQQEQQPHLSTSTSAVEAIERDEDEFALKGEAKLHVQNISHHGWRGWMPQAPEELHRLVEAFGRVLRGVSQHSFTLSTLPTFFSSRSHSCPGDVVYEVRLSDVSFDISTFSFFGTEERQRGGKCRETSTRQIDRGVLWLCGPYNQTHLLLRLDFSSKHMSSVPPLHRKQPLATDRDHRVRDSCCFYALADTQSELLLCFFDTTQAEAKTVAERAEATATAAVPVRSLIEAATKVRLSNGRDMCGGSSSLASTVHTIHLNRHGEAASYGAATFVVCVSAVRSGSTQQQRSDRFRGKTERLIHSADDSARSSLMHPPTYQQQIPLVTTMVEALEVSENLLKRQRAPLMSPSREGEESERNNDDKQEGSASKERKSSTCRGLKPLSETSSGKSTPFLTAESATVLEVVTQEAAVPLLTSSLPLLKCGVKKKEESKFTDAAEAPEAENDVDSHRSLSNPENTCDAKPAAALSPIHSSPPTPPPAEKSGPFPALAHVPAPPAGSALFPLSGPLSTAASLDTHDASSSPPTEQPINVRICVKSLRDLHAHNGSSGGDASSVEGLLEHCAVQVRVCVAKKTVLLVTNRRNPVCAVWSAEEGTCAAVLLPSQDICFEVVDASGPTETSVLAQAVVSPVDLIGKCGERELPLMSVADGAKCGILIVGITAVV